MELLVNRKPIFDAVRAVLGRGFRQSEVTLIDRGIDLALGLVSAAARRLGALSEQFESGGRGAGTVSSGAGDPGGVSYGLYQLSSRAGTAAAFVRSEGARWAAQLAAAAPGTAAFSAAWKDVAAREPAAFARAQHAFIERTHYRPAVEKVWRETALDLDARHDAVRDVTWSVAVQHGAGASILIAAILDTDARAVRDEPGYDRLLVEAVYRHRSDYVTQVAQRSSAASRRTLMTVVNTRYPAELRAALAMFDTPAAGG